MADNELYKFKSGAMDKGIDVYAPDFDSEFHFDESSYNLTSGINKGVGPRYGFAPIANHADTEAISGSELPGLRLAESANAGNYYQKNRQKILGIHELSLVPFWDFDEKPRPVYFWIMADYEDGTYDNINVQPNTEYASGSSPGELRYAHEFSYGFPQQTYNRMGGSWTTRGAFPCFRNLARPNGANSSNFLETVRIAKDTNFLSSAVFVASEKLIPQNWILGSAASGSVAGGPSNFVFSWSPTTGTSADFPEFVVTQRFELKPRDWKIYSIGSSTLQVEYDYSQAALTTSVITGTSIVATQLSAAVALVNRLDAVAPNYASIAAHLLYDPINTTKSGYKAILIAAKRPIMMLVQEWQKNGVTVASDNGDGSCQQYFDLGRRALDITSRTTGSEGVVSFYTEDSIRKATCWNSWPAFVRGTALGDSSATAFDGARHVRLGAAGSGVLRANSVYEFAFSLYHKAYDFETNVGIPAKVQTGSNDFVAITMHRDAKNGGGTFLQRTAGGLTYQSVGATASDIWPFNQIEVRIYYRLEGAQEWLPALFIDYSRYYADPNLQELWACQAPLAALPGGRPGGFNDYSPLPDGTRWDTVVTYRNRAFWFSKNSLIFSLRNNAFCYPGRNTTTIPQGEFRGGLVHNYPGQAEQSSRLIVFGSRETYVGRFTGAPLLTPVQVSVEAIGEYPIDGSDFVLDPWTSITAFSYRAAVVAEGIMYFAGPQGIHRDDGVATPTKISGPLEPDYFDLYDPNDTDNIFATYNDKTKEIIWFFKPKEDTGYETHAIVYNTLNGEFLPYQQFVGKIDNAFPINIKGSFPTYGQRHIAVVRNDADADIQRAYYFDHHNRAGDLRPTTEMMIEAVTAPSAGTRRIQLADGFDATNFATIAVGDYIAIDQIRRYGTAAQFGASTTSLIAKITAKGVNTLDFAMPVGATLGVANLTRAQYVPVWHRAAAGVGLNGIAWRLKSNYWMPEGVNYFGIWQWIYMLFRMDRWPTTDRERFTMAYRTPQSGAALSDIIEIFKNPRSETDGHFQLYHPLRVGQMANGGQALKLDLTGTHIGQPWVLEYVEAHAGDEDGNVLKTFEG